MEAIEAGKRGNFSSRFGAVMVAAGAAVGLGNIWGFPYQAGKNGGGAFIIIYVVAVLVLGVPLMISEFLIGARGQKNLVGSLHAASGKSAWKLWAGSALSCAFWFWLSTVLWQGGAFHTSSEP